MPDNSLAKTENYITSKQVMFSSVTDKQFMVGTAIGLLSIPFLWWWSGSIFALLFLYLLWHGFREWKEKNDFIDARFSEFVKELWYDRSIAGFIPKESKPEIDFVKIYSETKNSATKIKKLQEGFDRVDITFKDREPFISNPTIGDFETYRLLQVLVKNNTDEVIDKVNHTVIKVNISEYS